MTSTINKTSIDTQTSLIDRLRQLRRDTIRLNSGIIERLEPFRKTNGSFKTKPNSKDGIKTAYNKKIPDISVAATCTVIMTALLAGEKIQEKLFDLPGHPVEEVFKQTATAVPWASSGLDELNAFTTAIVLRTAGFVASHKIMSLADVAALKHRIFEPKDKHNIEFKPTQKKKKLSQIINERAKKSDGNAFRVSEYPPQTTHAYWFVDGVIGMQVPVASDDWKKIGEWASSEFHRQLIYVSAGNDALMDPPSLAMAACLISRIRQMKDPDSDLAKIIRKLPTTVELEFGIRQVFAKQLDSGIWHKYFPLFHFPRGQGAADYCFSFEFLEAAIWEFGDWILEDIHLIEKIQKVIEWCDTHELRYSDPSQKEKVYKGWNSGGALQTLKVGMAESWATASVHMFLTRLEYKINKVLNKLVLKRFGIDQNAEMKSQNSNEFNEFIDSTILFPSGQKVSLKGVIKDELLSIAKKVTQEPKEPINEDLPIVVTQEREELINEELPTPRSVLFFGPPGTSKSRLAKAISRHLGWPFILITPSKFLGKGLENVHAEVSYIFDDLMDLRRAVVFFDEMDALAQTREGDKEETKGEGKQEENKGIHQAGDLDVTRQLLTTSMLPKLAALWEKKQVIFLMATNHKRLLDPAITRPNRFDLLLCVGPPPWKNKCTVKCIENVLKLVSQGSGKDVVKKLNKLIQRDTEIKKLLDNFTIDEVGIFLDQLRRTKKTASILEALEDFTNNEFSDVVKEWSRKSITLRKDGPPFTLDEFEKDREESRRQYYRKAKKNKARI